MNKKLIYYIIPLMLLSLAAQGCGKKEEVKAPEVVRPVKTVVVAGNEAFSRTYPGRVQGSDAVNISFRVSGPLLEFPANEGDKIKKGELLAKMDPRDYDIALAKAKAEFVKADADFLRYQKLYEKDAVALADLDLYRSNRDVAKAQLKNAEDALKDTILKAPFDATIGRIYADNFQEVRAQESIMSIYDASNVEILIDLPENIVALYKGGTEAAMSASFEIAPGKSFPLKLKEFSTQADPATQTYKTTLIMPSPKNINILPGMTAVVKIGFDQNNFRGKQNVSIPSIAVFAGDSGESFVWVVGPQMTVGKRQIQVGGMTGSASIEVKSGLKAGERVVIAGIKQLKEGMKVSLLQ